MKYLYWAFLALIVFGGIGVTVYFGLEPKSLPKIKPSQMASPERFGELIAQRLWEELKSNPVIFLGVDPDKPDDMRVWKGFLDSLQSPELKFVTIVMEPALVSKNLISFSEEIDIKNEVPRFIAGLNQALAAHSRVAVIVPTIYSAQAIVDNPIRRIVSESEIRPLSLSLVEPTLNRKEEPQAQYPCATGSGDINGLGSWGCLIQTKSRSLYRKSWETNKYLGLMDQIGAKDYLVLFRFVK